MSVALFTLSVILATMELRSFFLPQIVILLNGCWEGGYNVRLRIRERMRSASFWEITTAALTDEITSPPVRRAAKGRPGNVLRGVDPVRSLPATVPAFPFDLLFT